jgi:7tm Odorant receptor
MKSFKFLEALKAPLSILKLAGLWENESVEKKHKVLQIIMHFFVYYVFTFLQIVYLITAKDYQDIVDLLKILLTGVVFIIKSLHLLKERKKIEALIEETKELARLIETEDENSLQALNNRAVQIQTVFKALMSCGLFTISMMVINTILINIIGTHPPYKFLFKLWLPFNCENNVYCFSFTEVYEIIVAVVSFIIMASLDTLPIFFFNIGAGFLEDLAERLNKVCDEEKEDKAVMKEFEKCIAIHIKIKRFVKNAEKRFSLVVCAQGSSSIVILCTVIFLLSKVKFSDFI